MRAATTSFPGVVGPRGDLTTLFTQDPAVDSTASPSDFYRLEGTGYRRLRRSRFSEEGRCRSQDRVVFPEATVLGVQPFHLGLLLSSDPVAGIDLALDHPATHGLPPHPSCFAKAAAAAVATDTRTRARSPRTPRAFSSGSIILGMVLILLDSDRTALNLRRFRHLHCRVDAATSQVRRDP